MSKRVALFALACLTLLAYGCSTVENSAEEGKNAFQAGMRTKEKAKDYAGQKESYDRQAEDF